MRQKLNVKFHQYLLTGALYKDSLMRLSKVSDQYFTMLLSLVSGRIYDKALRSHWQYIAQLMSYDQSFADFHIILIIFFTLPFGI